MSEEPKSATNIIEHAQIYSLIRKPNYNPLNLRIFIKSIEGIGVEALKQKRPRPYDRGR